MQILPFRPSIAHYRVSTNLGRETFVFDVRWNGRLGVWVFDLREEDATPIRLGVWILLGVELNPPEDDPRWPGGVLLASDLSGEKRDSGFDDLGERVKVYYFGELS